MNIRRGISKCKRERERKKKEKAVWQGKVINYDLPGDFFDCYEGWVDDSTRVSGIRRCIYPSRSCVPSSFRAAIESLYGATLLHARLLLFNREKKYFLKTLVFSKSFFVEYYFFFFFFFRILRVSMKIEVESFSSPPVPREIETKWTRAKQVDHFVKFY